MSTITAPIALLKCRGVIIGKCKTVRVSDNIERGTVKGIGELGVLETPVTGWSGTISISSVLIDLSSPILPGSLRRKVQSKKEFFDGLLFEDENDKVNLELLQKIKVGETVTGQPIPGFKSIATIGDIRLKGENFDISEGQIAGRDVSGVYLDPYIFPF